MKKVLSILVLLIVCSATHAQTIWWWNSHYATFKKSSIYSGYINSSGDTIMRLSDKGSIGIGKNSSPTADSSVFSPGIGMTILGDATNTFPYLRFRYFDGTTYNGLSIGIDGNHAIFWPQTSSLTEYRFYVNNVNVFDIQANNIVSAKPIIAPNVLSIGTINLSGDGTSTTFNIPHGIGLTPTYWFVTPASSAAAGVTYITADATNVIIHYAVPPALGTNNLTFKYQIK